MRTQYDDRFSRDRWGRNQSILGARHAYPVDLPADHMKFGGMKPWQPSARYPTGFSKEDVAKYKGESTPLDILYFQEMDSTRGWGIWYPLLTECYRHVSSKGQFPINWWLLNMNSLLMGPGYEPLNPTEFVDMSALATDLLGVGWIEQAPEETGWRRGGIKAEEVTFEQAMTTMRRMVQQSWQCTVETGFRAPDFIENYLLVAVQDLDTLFSATCCGRAGRELAFSGQLGRDTPLQGGGIFSDPVSAKALGCHLWSEHLQSNLYKILEPIDKTMAKKATAFGSKRPSPPEATRGGSNSMPAGHLTFYFKYRIGVRGKTTSVDRWLDARKGGDSVEDRGAVYRLFLAIVGLIKAHPLTQAFRWPNTQKKTDPRKNWGVPPNPFHARVDDLQNSTEWIVNRESHHGAVIDFDRPTVKGLEHLEPKPQSRYTFLWKYVDDAFPELKKIGGSSPQPRWFSDDPDSAALFVNHLSAAAQRFMSRRDPTEFWKLINMVENMGVFDRSFTGEPLARAGTKELDIPKGYVKKVSQKLAGLAQKAPSDLLAQFGRWRIGTDQRIQRGDQRTPKERTEKDLLRWAASLASWPGRPGPPPGRKRKNDARPAPDHDVPDEKQSTETTTTRAVTVSNDPKGYGAERRVRQSGARPITNVHESAASDNIMVPTGNRH